LALKEHQKTWPVFFKAILRFGLKKGFRSVPVRVKFSISGNPPLNSIPRDWK